MAGIKDVAKKAEVSVTTVSRVLNKRGYISEEMYQRVYQAIDELNYCPNQIARNLYLKRTFMVGLLIPDISHPFFARLTKHIEMDLNHFGYKMILCNTIEQASKEKEYMAMLRQNKADGIIVGSHALDISDYLKATLPMVSIDRKLGDRIPNVSSNHQMGGELAARKLMENGCKNVVQVMGDRRMKTALLERHTAFQKMLKKNGVRCSTIELKKTEFCFGKYSKAIQEVLSSNSNIDGVFAVDSIAARILQTAQLYGIRVPEDLKIVGYGGSELAGLTYPRLTTVCQDCSALSHSIVNALVLQIEHKEVGKIDHVHDVTLLEGGTTVPITKCE